MNAEWSQIPKVINDLARRIFVNKYIGMCIFCYLIMISQLHFEHSHDITFLKNVISYLLFYKMALSFDI